MVHCPVCGADSPPEASNCRSCQLATSLFEPVREAAGTSSDDSEYARAIAEILAVVGPDIENAEPPAGNGSVPMMTAQARFPSLGEGRPKAEAPALQPTLPNLPVLPPGSGLSVAQRQVEELLQTGRREGLDLKGADDRMMAALKEGNLGALDEVRRTAFVHVAGSVAEDLEVQSARRNELAPLVVTASVDAELSGARAAFGAGDLSGTVRRLRQASEGLSALEEEWATCQILTTEADLMVETLRELGRDPGPALGPLAEGRRLARAGDSNRAEHVLAGANRALWELLVPQLSESLQGIRAQLHGRAGTDQDIEPVIRELRQLAALIRRRNFGAAVTTYRRLRSAASALASPALA